MIRTNKRLHVTHDVRAPRRFFVYVYVYGYEYEDVTMSYPSLLYVK